MKLDNCQCRYKNSIRKRVLERLSSFVQFLMHSDMILCCSDLKHSLPEHRDEVHSGKVLVSMHTQSCDLLFGLCGI
jgi:hypothetical protein